MHGSEGGGGRFKKEKEDLVIESLVIQKGVGIQSYVMKNVIGESVEALKDSPGVPENECRHVVEKGIMTWHLSSTTSSQFYEAGIAN